MTYYAPIHWKKTSSIDDLNPSIWSSLSMYVAHVCGCHYLFLSTENSQMLSSGAETWQTNTMFRSCSFIWSAKQQCLKLLLLRCGKTWHQGSNLQKHLTFNISFTCKHLPLLWTTAKVYVGNCIIFTCNIHSRWKAIHKL